MASYNLVQLVFNRDLLSPDEDVAVMTMHIREVVQGAPDILPVTDQGRDNFVADLSSWWTELRAMITTKVVLHEARFYDVPDGPGKEMGDPVKIQPFQSPGTATGKPMPPQLAVSVTYKTDTRKWWGRNYIPGITTSSLDDNGRLLTTDAGSIAQAFHHLTSRGGTGAALVVFSKTHWAHKDPSEIQVDDIVDVIRRRRFSEPHARQIVSAG